MSRILPTAVKNTSDHSRFYDDKKYLFLICYQFSVCKTRPSPSLVYCNDYSNQIKINQPIKFNYSTNQSQSTTSSTPTNQSNQQTNHTNQPITPTNQSKSTYQSHQPTTIIKPITPTNRSQPLHQSDQSTYQTQSLHK